MKPRKIRRLRKLIDQPSYPFRRLEDLQVQFGEYAGAWAAGRDLHITAKGMERTSRKIDRVRKEIEEIRREIERERIHRKYIKENLPEGRR